MCYCALAVYVLGHIVLFWFVFFNSFYDVMDG